MILDQHIAVVWRVSGTPPSMNQKQIVSLPEWEELLDAHHCDRIVIVEAWVITEGRCLQN